MKTVLIQGRKKVALQEVPVPRAFDNYAVVRIHSAPMCTEYRAYANGETKINPGHEAAGEIVEITAPGALKAGDRVIVMPQYPCGACDLCLQGDYIHCQHIQNPLHQAGIEHGTGTYAEYILKPDWLLIPIPDDLSYDEAAMACCGLGPAFGAAKTMNVNAGDTVLVTGLGPVGLGAIIACTHRHAKVIGATRNEYRQSLAVQLGAALIIDPSSPHAIEKIMQFTDGKGADKVIECSGQELYQQLAINSVRRKGQVAFIGESSAFPFNISRDILRKGISLHGIWHWNLNDTDEMIDLIRTSKQKISKLITHIFPLEKIEEAFELQLTGHCGKVILRP
jgi:L-iditol 2-dehydrogenase